MLITRSKRRVLQWVDKCRTGSGSDRVLGSTYIPDLKARQDHVQLEGMTRSLPLPVLHLLAHNERAADFLCKAFIYHSTSKRSSARNRSSRAKPQLLRPRDRNNPKPGADKFSGDPVDFEAASGATEGRVVFKRTATNYVVLLFTASHPGASICWCVDVVVVIPILTPFPDVAVHIE